MRVFLSGLFLLIVSLEAGCSGQEVLKCHGTFLLDRSNVDQVKSPVEIGFKIVRQWPILKPFSKSDWKGFVNLSYATEPYGRPFSGGGVMDIARDDESVWAVGSATGKSESVMYDAIDNVVRYENDHDEQVETISGKCARQL